MFISRKKTHDRILEHTEVLNYIQDFHFQEVTEQNDRYDYIILSGDMLNTNNNKLFKNSNMNMHRNRVVNYYTLTVDEFLDEKNNSNNNEKIKDTNKNKKISSSRKNTFDSISSSNNNNSNSISIDSSKNSIKEKNNLNNSNTNNNNKNPLVFKYNSLVLKIERKISYENKISKAFTLKDSITNENTNSFIEIDLKLNFCKYSKFFSFLSEDYKEKIAMCLKPKIYKKGETIYKQGTYKLYFISKGVVISNSSSNNQNITDDISNMLFSHKSANDILGFNSYLYKKTKFYEEAIAMTEVECYTLSFMDFNSLFPKNRYIRDYFIRKVSFKEDIILMESILLP